MEVAGASPAREADARGRRDTYSLSQRLSAQWNMSAPCKHNTPRNRGVSGAGSCAGKANVLKGGEGAAPPPRMGLGRIYTQTGAGQAGDGGWTMAGVGQTFGSASMPKG